MEIVEMYFKDGNQIFKTKDNKWYCSSLKWNPIELSDEEINDLTNKTTL